MSKHTPGPWGKLQAIDHTAAEIRTESGIAVATVFGSDIENTEANARLISAAPDMLELLQLINEASKGHVPLNNHWLEVATSAVISKATRN